MGVIVELNATVDNPLQSIACKVYHGPLDVQPGKSSSPFIINVIQSDWYCLNDKESLEFFSLYLKQNDVN